MLVSAPRRRIASTIWHAQARIGPVVRVADHDQERARHLLVDQRIAAARVEADRRAKARLGQHDAASSGALEARSVDDGDGEHAAVRPADDTHPRRIDVGLGLQEPERADRVVESLGVRRRPACSASTPCLSRRGVQLSTSNATYPCSRNQRDHSWFDSEMPAQPCRSTTAGNGPGPVGRSSHPGTVSGLPGVAFGKDRVVVAHPAMTIETRSTDSRRRSMNRAYTAPQRAAKLEASGRAQAHEAGFRTMTCRLNAPTPGSA